MKLGGADGYDARREEEKLQVRRRKRNKEDKGTTFMGYVFFMFVFVCINVHLDLDFSRNWCLLSALTR